MRIAMLSKWPRWRPGLLVLVGALSAIGCGVETVESVRRHNQTEPQALAPSSLGVTDFGVPTASKVDFGYRSPLTTSDLTY
jgi:hypothetical protein